METKRFANYVQMKLRLPLDDLSEVLGFEIGIFLQFCLWPRAGAMFAMYSFLSGWIRRWPSVWIEWKTAFAHGLLHFFIELAMV